MAKRGLGDAAKTRVKAGRLLRAVDKGCAQFAVQSVLRDVQQAFYGLCVNDGKQVRAVMMESDHVDLRSATNVPDTGRLLSSLLTALVIGRLSMLTIGVGGRHWPYKHSL